MRTLFRGALHGAGAADSVLVEGEVITWVGRGDPPSRPDEEVVAAPGEIIAPGFIDLQVNGYAGHDAAAGADSIAALSDALPATGVTAFLPTLISAPVEVGAGFAAAVGAAAEAQGARVLGAHVDEVAAAEGAGLVERLVVLFGVVRVRLQAAKDDVRRSSGRATGI